VETNKDIASTLKKVKLNLAMLPSEPLHTLQDGVIAELQAREQCMLNVISEQNINNAQMLVEMAFTIDLVKKIIENNEHTIVVVVEACRTVSELNILKYAHVDAKIQKLTAGVHDARTMLAKV